MDPLEPIKMTPLRQLVSDIPFPRLEHPVSMVTFYVLFLFVALAMVMGAPSVFVRNRRLIPPAPNKLLRFTSILTSIPLPPKTLTLTPRAVSVEQTRDSKKPVRPNLSLCL